MNTLPCHLSFPVEHFQKHNNGGRIALYVYSPSLDMCILSMQALTYYSKFFPFETGLK